ncbi:MAG: insulinase family protein [Candidatus Kapaibacterium sp.]
MKKLSLFLFIIFFVAANSFAQTDHTKKPAPGPVPKSAFPPFSETKLKNGLRVVIVENHKQPLVFFRMLVLSGNAQDHKSVGAASAVATLLEKGTTTRSAADIAKKLDYYGAEVGAGASVDDINVFISCMKKDMGEVLPIYADVIKNPIFPKEEFDKYSSRTISGLIRAKQSPGELGRKMGRILTYGDHPYGEIITEESIKKLDPEILKAWHKENFCAENAIIAVVGDVTEKEIVPMLEKQFGDWQKGAKVQTTYPPLDDTRGMTISLVNRPSSVQSTIRLQSLGLSATNKNFDKASLLMSIFAGNGVIGFQNRLFQNIREKHGYTYTPGGALTTSLDRGIMVAVAEVRNAVTDSALDQMLIEYRRLSSEQVPKAELDFAKGLITGKYLMDLANPQLTSAKALSILEYGLPKDYYSTYATRMSGYSSEDLQDAGQKVFPPGDLNIIVVGDATQVKAKLERFGRVNVYDLDLKPVKYIAEVVKPGAMTLDQVLELMYKGMNKPALEKLKSRQIEGEKVLSLTGDVHKAKMTTIEEAPNKKYEKADFGAPIIMEARNDGQHIFQYYPGGNGVVNPNEKEELASTIFNDALHLRDPGNSVTLMGTTETPGGEAYVLDIMFGGIAHRKWYVNTKTGYITRKSEISGEESMTTDYSDFQTVDGIPYPFKEESHGASDETFTVTSIKHNVQVDEKLFMKK